METKNKVTRTIIFKLALISSILLFLSLFYGQKLFSELWLIYGFIQIGIFIFFFVTVVWGLIFWIRKKKEYKAAFVPLLVTITFLGLVIILPLNKIRNKIEFVINRNRLENAVTLVLESDIRKTEHRTSYELPGTYKSLSTGGGEVIVVSKFNSTRT